MKHLPPLLPRPLQWTLRIPWPFPKIMKKTKMIIYLDPYINIMKQNNRDIPRYTYLAACLFIASHFYCREAKTIVGNIATIHYIATPCDG